MLRLVVLSAIGLEVDCLQVIFQLADLRGALAALAKLQLTHIAPSAARDELLRLADAAVEREY